MGASIHSPDVEHPDTHRAQRDNNGDEFRSLSLIVLLSLVFGIAAFGTDMYLPAFPSIRRSFAVEPQVVQLSLSLFLYGNAIGHLIFGPLSDRYGRKPILLWGLAAYACASFGCALAADIHQFLWFRLIQGGAAASGPVLIRALLNDRLDRHAAAQMLALLTGTMAFIAMLTPSVGGWLVQYYPWQWIFYGLGLTGIVVLITSAVRIDESLSPPDRLTRLGVKELFEGYKTIGRSLRFWCYVLPPSLMFAGVFAYAVVNSFLLIDELGMAEQLYGISYSIAATAYVLGSFTSRWLVRRLGIDRGIIVGLSLGVVTATGAVLASLSSPMSIPLVVIPGLCIFFSTSLILPIAFSMSVSLFPHHGGSASAVAGCTQLGFAGLSSGFAAYLYDRTTMPLHIFTLSCCIAACVLWLAGSRIRASSHNI